MLEGCLFLPCRDGIEDDKETLHLIVAALTDVVTEKNPDMPPEDLILVCRTNLTRLEVLVEKSSIKEMVGKRYLPLLQRLWVQALDETNVLQFAAASGLVPSLLNITKKVFAVRFGH